MNNRLRLVIPAAVCAAALLMTIFAGPAAAAAVSGTTGLLQVPTADALGHGQARLAIGFDGAGLLPAVAYGVVPGLEIGVTAGPGGAVMARAKYQLAPETAGAPGLAVGVEGSSWYAVMSRRLAQPGLRVHLGAGSGNLGPIVAGVEARLRSVAVARADSPVMAPAVSLVLDYDGHAAALGARLDFASGFTVSAGVRAGHGIVGSAAYGVRF